MWIQSGSKKARHRIKSDTTINGSVCLVPAKSSKRIFEGWQRLTGDAGGAFSANNDDFNLGM